MITAKFHENEQPHSLLGFGGMRFPTLPDGTIDEARGKEMVDAAISAGVNYFDTAYGYHEEKSEGFLKKALLKYPRESYFLADKLPIWRIKEAADMEQTFNEQLERCGVDYFDYYLVHALGKERVETMKRVDTVGFLKAKQAQGKIRHLGFSFHDDLDCLREILGMHSWDFCQLQLNYADWNRFKYRELYELAEERGVPVIVMEPVRGGFLANPPTQVAELFRAADPKRSMASWALRFVATLPNVKLILSGMSNLEQVKDNLATFQDENIRLSAPEQQVVARAMELMDNMNTVPCTGCRYCMPCPNGVDIPGIFHIYNNVELFGRGEDNYMDSIAPAARGDACISCGACLSACPQSIAIPDCLAKAHARLTAKKKG